MPKTKPNLWPLLPFAVLLLFVALSQIVPDAHADSGSLRETVEAR